MRASIEHCVAVLVSAVALTAFAPAAAAQEGEFSRWDAYAGFTYFHSTNIEESERGYTTQVGYNPKSWYAFGFDYTRVEGTLNLTPSLLPEALQMELAPLLGDLPPTYHPAVPTDTLTQTFAAGPTLVIRHFHHMGILIHPSLGALYEYATPHPQDLITTVATSLLFTGVHKTDWTGFYGIGGGVDITPTRHFGLRLQTDLVWDHVINDVLGKGHWTVRLSIGPSFHFGKTAKY